MAADSPPIKAPDIPRTASKVSQSRFWTPIHTPLLLIDVLSEIEVARRLTQDASRSGQLTDVGVLANGRLAPPRAVIRRNCHSRSSQMRNMGAVDHPRSTRCVEIDKPLRTGRL